MKPSRQLDTKRDRGNIFNMTDILDLYYLLIPGFQHLEVPNIFKNCSVLISNI